MRGVRRNAAFIVGGAVIGLVVALVVDLADGNRIVLDLPTGFVETNGESNSNVEYLGGGGGGGRVEGETTDLPGASRLRLTLARGVEPVRLDLDLETNTKGAAATTYSIYDDKRLVGRQMSPALEGNARQTRSFEWLPIREGSHTLDVTVEDTKYQTRTESYRVPLIDNGTVPGPGRDWPLLVTSAMYGSLLAAFIGAALRARTSRGGKSGGRRWSSSASELDARAL